MKAKKEAIAFIVEGHTEERQLKETLIPKFFPENEYEIYVYEANSKQFFQIFSREIKAVERSEHVTPDLDILLNNVFFPGEKRKFSRYYLLFDLDVQQNDIWCNLQYFLANERLEEFLNDANISIFISYPMWEAIKDFTLVEDGPVLNDFVSYPKHKRKYYSSDGREMKSYKDYVHQKSANRYANIGKIVENDSLFSQLLDLHLQKASKILGCDDLVSSSIAGQREIFHQQRTKFWPENKIAVLSAIPFLLHNYYGENIPCKCVPLKTCESSL